jgi:CDP-diglyceride synthetase
MFNQSLLPDALVALCVFVGLLACLEFAYLLGKRAHQRRAEHPDQLSSIQGAMLGLLALLLGFSFAVTMGRFSDREKLIVAEANAIGTTWLRCDLLPEPVRQEMRQALRDYTTQRIAFYDAKDETARTRSIVAAEKLHVRLWDGFSSAAKATPGHATVLLPPLNELIDLHGSRLAAARRHMPSVLLGLLLVCSLISVAAVGYGCGVAGKRNVVLTTALSFLIAGVLWAIIDMDHPRQGLIRVGQQPMLDLQESLKR